MTLITKLRNRLSAINPWAKKRRREMRAALKNTDFSLLCPNCMGGILCHDLGLRFLSPTVNMMLLQTDFVRLVTDLPHYLAEDPVYFQHEEYTCPCAHLDDITLHFTHYHTPEEATAKWNERKARLNMSNLFIVASERDGLTREDILKLGEIPCRGLLVFTATNYADIPYAYQLPPYAGAAEVGNILKKVGRSGAREYELYFDFVKWFNEADGSRDITPFIKKP